MALKMLTLTTLLHVSFWFPLFHKWKSSWFTFSLQYNVASSLIMSNMQNWSIYIWLWKLQELYQFSSSASIRVFIRCMGPSFIFSSIWKMCQTNGWRMSGSLLVFPNGDTNVIDYLRHTRRLCTYVFYRHTFFTPPVWSSNKHC